jgi:hypothetical protein
MTRELVPELVQGLPARLAPGERLAEAAVAKSSGGPGLLAVTDRRVLFIPSSDPEHPQELGYGEVGSISERASGELVALALLGRSGSPLLEIEVSPPNAARIVMHVRSRIATPPVSPDPTG